MIKKLSFFQKYINITQKLSQQYSSNQNPEQFNNYYKRHEDILYNYVKIESNFDRFNKIIKSAYLSLKDPENGVHISELGCLTSYQQLKRIQQLMLQDKEGQQILLEKPRINKQSINLEQMKNLDENTLGFNVYKYWSNHGFDPEERPKSKYIQDFELAYIYQRYKEIHDILHIILGYDITIMDEVIIKWFEMIQLGLPSASLASLITPITLSQQERTNLFENHLTSIIQNANNSQFSMNTYYEKYFDVDLVILFTQKLKNQFRKQIGIIPCKFRTLF